MSRAGLVLLGLLSLLDVPSVLITDGEFPPMWVAVAGTVLGVVSLALLLPAWRGSRPALTVLLVLRALSAVSAVPGLLVDGVPAQIRLLAGAIVVLGALGCALAAPALRRAPATPRPG